MKKKTMLALLLAGCCLLAGCSTTASDEDVFGQPHLGDSDPVVQQSSAGEEAPPSEGAPEDAVTPSQEAAPSEYAEPSQAVEPTEEVAPSPSQDVGGSGPQPSADAPASAAPVQSAAPAQNSAAPVSSQPVYIDQVPMSEDVNLADEMVPLATSPAAVPVILSPVASGTAVNSGGGAEIDYSNTKDGYVMARFAGSSSKRLRVQVTGPTTTYTYDLTTGAWVTYPLSDGSGGYKVTVLQNTTGKKYAILASVSFQAALTDEFAPFVRPNQYVNYEGAANTINKAAQLTGNISEPLKKVAAVYDFVVKNLTYDYQRATAVSNGQLSGYLPNLDSVLAERKGICFDYAALMTGMLRSQGVPCKLVVGYAGTVYHAWVSVWTAETGWVDGVIYFDGTTWQRMDPTFASSGNTQFTLNANNYKVKFLY